MKFLFIFLALLESCYGDANVLGYELGLIEESIDQVKNELLSDSLSGIPQLKDYYRKLKTLRHERKKGNKKTVMDISNYQFITLLCKLEQIWSFAIGQLILCLLSRSFSRMKLKSILLPGIYDPPLPTKDHTNKRIYHNDAKYLARFLKHSESSIRRTTVVDIFYYSLQHLILTTHSLLSYHISPFLNAIHWPLPPATSSQSYSHRQRFFSSPEAQVALPISSTDNICRTILYTIPTYAPYFHQTMLAKYEVSYRNAAEKLRKKSHKFLRVHSLCNSLLTSSNSAPEIPSPIFNRPTHHSLASLAKKSIPPFFATFHHYSDELFQLQNYLLTQINKTPPYKHSITYSIHDFLTTIESINLSLFSILVFCGTDYTDALMKYAQRDNIFSFFNPRTTFVTSEDRMGWMLGKLNLPQRLLNPSMQKQLSFLLTAAVCGISALENLSLLKNERVSGLQMQDDSAFSDMIGNEKEQLKSYQRDLQKAKETGELIKENAVKAISTWQLGDRRQRGAMTRWHQRYGTCFVNTHELAFLAVELSVLLEKWVDLEKVYRFPLSYVLEKASVVESVPSYNAQLMDNNVQEESSEKLIQNESSSLYELDKRESDMSDRSVNLCEFGLPETKARGFIESSLEKIMPVSPKAHPIEEDTNWNKNTVTKQLDGFDLTTFPHDLFANPSDSWQIDMEEPFLLPVLNTKEKLSRAENLLEGEDCSSPLLRIDNTYHETLPTVPYNAKVIPNSLPFKLKSNILLPYSFATTYPYNFDDVSLLERDNFLENLSNSSEKSSIKHEMQFWLLVNHHPREISSCFTYTFHEAKETEDFVSSLMLPDAVAMFPSETAHLGETSFFKVYGWNRIETVKHNQINDYTDLIEFLKYQFHYERATEQQSYTKNHSIQTQRLITEMTNLTKKKVGIRGYSRKITLSANRLVLEKLFKAMLFSFEKRIYSHAFADSLVMISRNR